MTTAIFTHPSSLLHETGPGHPERIDRIAAIHAALAKGVAAHIRELL